jgi:hypothetical protein
LGVLGSLLEWLCKRNSMTFLSLAIDFHSCRCDRILTTWYVGLPLPSICTSVPECSQSAIEGNIPECLPTPTPPDRAWPRGCPYGVVGPLRLVEDGA